MYWLYALVLCPSCSTICMYILYICMYWLHVLVVGTSCMSLLYLLVVCTRCIYEKVVDVLVICTSSMF